MATYSVQWSENAKEQLAEIAALHLALIKQKVRGILVAEDLANRDRNRLMKKESTTVRGPKKSQNKKVPLDPREYPLARDARGSARREEIRSKTPVVSAPRQSRRPMERSNQKRTHS
jgi:hypothetical protein